MAGKIWKEYVHRHLQQLEASSEDTGTSAVSSDTGDTPALIESEPLTWCRSVERCLAYTFESYCKLLITTAVHRTQAANKTVLTASEIRDSINTVFKLPGDIDSAPAKDPNHDLERCLSLYRGYLAWYSRLGHRIYKANRRRRLNLSCERMMWRMFATPHSRNGEHGGTEAPTADDLEKYAYAPPTHKTLEVPLNQVFGI
ncbi:uncharacterized protein BXIN_1394 [Babesia sp. Xinjiang]|uniref:uncharacterized protein n=1 Tax=Babesia sp. Xinjiang TaxID=462227 RepID=UPI000A22D3AB|nr:uncharacterized protein BXIN_1394 [Babesia sp. Xinjiang]ORM39965.1 hypothetical protein BXIN_1394 [Babesia sp. Xinjiang]